MFNAALDASKELSNSLIDLPTFILVGIFLEFSYISKLCTETLSALPQRMFSTLFLETCSLQLLLIYSENLFSLLENSWELLDPLDSLVHIVFLIV